VPSDKIRLYAFDKHPIVLNKGLKLGFHQLKQFVYILLSYRSSVLNTGSKHFAIQLMKFV